MDHTAPGTRGNLLVVEDDDSIRELLSAALRFAGYAVDLAPDGATALRACERRLPDLIVLDVGLPDLDGFEVCRRIRASGAEVAVIFLTARRELDDVREGYAGGGDDYVTKPFSVDELAFRIEAVLRRTGRRGGPSPGRLVCGDITIDEQARRVWVSDREVVLTPTEYRLLQYLVVNAGQVLTRVQILEHVWGLDFEGDWQIIETYISSLRRKVDVDHDAPIIHTVRGVGYMARRPALR